MEKINLTNFNHNNTSTPQAKSSNNINTHTSQHQNTSTHRANLFNIQRDRGNTTNTNTLGKYSAGSEQIYLQAEYLLEMLAKQQLSITLLNPAQKLTIFLYLFKYNAKLGRIVDLFVSIPLSGIELRYPDTIENQILLDYVKDFFNKMWSDTKLQDTIMRAYRDYKLFGFGAMLCSDDFSFSQKIVSEEGIREETTLDLSNLKKSLDLLAKPSKPKDPKRNKENKELEDIYLKNSSDVSVKDRSKVIYSLVCNLQAEELVNLKDGEVWADKYQGVTFVKNIDPFEALNRTVNRDIDFYQCQLPTDNNLKAFYNSSDLNKLDLAQVENSLVQLGYSKAYLNLFSTQEETVNIDTYPYTPKDTWLAVLENSMAYSNIDKSILNRVINQAIDMEIIAKSNRTKSNRAFKNIYLFSTEATGENFQTMDTLLKQAIDSDESVSIFTNKTINSENISFDSRQLVDLDSLAQKAEDDLINGLGMVDTLTGGADSYANSYLKLEMLEKQFSNERITLATFIEEQILKPVAIKKGLFNRDEWGQIKAIYPKVVFDRINFARSTEDFSLLVDLASQKKIPYSYIMKALNFNPEEMQRLVVQEQSTVYNDNLVGYVTNKIIESEEFGKIIMKDKGHIEAILKSLNIAVTSEKIQSIIQAFNNRALEEDEVEEIADNLYEKYQEDNPQEEEGSSETTLEEPKIHEPLIQETPYTTHKKKLTKGKVLQSLLNKKP